MTNHRNRNQGRRDGRQLTDREAFGIRVNQRARPQCEELLGSKAGRQVAQRITMAILSSMQAARDPSGFFHCTDLSLSSCIALSAQTRLMPGGPYPAVYLVPQAPRRGAPPELQWRITTRGIAILAARNGFGVRAVPVGANDFLQVSLGEVVEHNGDPGYWPVDLSEIAGVAVIVRDLEHGHDVIRAWVPLDVIVRRRDMARTDKMWREWPIEMAQKTAIKYAMARGIIPLDSPELATALTEEIGDAVIEGTARAVEQLPERGRELPQRQAPALPDNGPTFDEFEHARPEERERVAAGAPPVVDAQVEAPVDPQAPTGDQTLAQVKADCARLESQLHGAAVSDIREKFGPPGTESVTSWKGRITAATEYRDALQSELDAEAKRIGAGGAS